MELRHLSYFAKVADAGSVSRAAEMLHMTQPSLSRQIAVLEREIGQRLFERTPGGMVLTPAGRGLYEHTQVVFAQVERIPEVVRTFQAHREIVRVGLPPGVPHEWFLAVLDHARAELPQVAVSLLEASSNEQQAMVRNGLVDLALLHSRPTGLKNAGVLRQQLGAAVPPDSPLRNHAAVRFTDLHDRQVMAHAADEVTREEDRLRAASAAAGVRARWVFRRFSEHAALIAESTKVDAVLVTRASAGRNLPGWTWVPFVEKDAAGESLAVLTWAAWRNSAPSATERLVEIMSQEGKRADW
ncbi:LysR family transcriptional regulator [Georgenia sp. AZ-5]|uniref:LysR family transcriptional regulator n=1 Tax=Georgenia sp. AZ-5 TaxID=3367526 RepID=UPI00375485B7